MALFTLLCVGLLAQANALQIPSNNTDAVSPSSGGILRSETEGATSHYPLKEEEEDDLIMEIVTTLQPDVTNSYDDANRTLSRETNITTSLDSNLAVFHEKNTSIFPETDTTKLEENNTTMIPETSSTSFQDEHTTAIPQADTKVFPDASTDSLQSECPGIGGRPVAQALVKCHCKGNEILVDGECQVYDGVTVIPVQYEWINTKEETVSNYTVIVQDVNCDPSKYQNMNFTKGQFHLRPRGDIVLLENAGKLDGQRINNYCIVHHLDDQGDLTLTVKACVPIPSVPRCCPPGKAMKNGRCEDAQTPDVLTPPISAKPFGDNLAWPNITNYLSTVKCDSEPLITIPLGHRDSNLVNLAGGVGNGWVPGTDKRRIYYNCPEYCVDGIKNSDGSVGYFTSFCYRDPIVTHKEACAKGTCLRKCCKSGYSMDINLYSCVPDPNPTFNPPTDIDISNYNIVIGWPLCTPVSKVEEKISVDRTGNLLKDRTFTSSDFCVDTFLDNDNREQSALACLTETSLWLEVRPYLFPICNVISLIFLMITIISHLLVPRLLANGGLHQLCHVIALSIAYITSVSVHVFHNSFADEVCVNIAIAMQFGFLTTFFWLNVMCFEIWRKLRRLKNYRPVKSYPNKYYMMYGWGIPFCICVITIVMQKCAPDNMWGVIKPYIGFSRCWFREDIALLVYFYGPIAVLFFCNSVFLFLTYINYKIMLRNYKETTNDLKNLGTGVISDQRNMSSSMPSRQITDHVHDFNQKLKIFILMATCWVTELLSWKIPPLELWALTDTLNCLQGFFLFIILLSNSNKRKHLEERYPRIFAWITKSTRFPTVVKRWLQNGIKVSLSPVSSFTSSISRQLSNSTVLSALTSSIKSPTPSSTSFKLSSSSPSSEVQSSVSLDDPEKGVIVLSHSSLQSLDSNQGLADPSLQSSKTLEALPNPAC
ncbi:uncharacterized protein [Macrobrachium rosenbergii]|uniref:uncharacterized protein n=1 Tax=Macrobrachium rosenbergii TaxID=79674 RepID=UPI0034D5F9D0